jgi:uncharacterized membrane protein YeiH
MASASVDLIGTLVFALEGATAALEGKRDIFGVMVPPRGDT